MSGVYGSMLTYFPELLSVYEIFSMDAKISGGYANRKIIKKVHGYLSFYNRDSLGIEGGLRNVDKTGSLFIYESASDTPLPLGSYIESGASIFVIDKYFDYRKEGGYGEYRFKAVTGFTDTQKENRKVREVILGDYA